MRVGAAQTIKECDEMKNAGEWEVISSSMCPALLHLAMQHAAIRAEAIPWLYTCKLEKGHSVWGG